MERNTDQASSKLHNHELIIDRSLVLPILQKYVHEFNFLKLIPEKEHNKDFSVTLTRLISSKDINLFWRNHRNAFLKDDELLWNALDVGFNKYLQVQLLFVSFLKHFQ